MPGLLVLAVAALFPQSSDRIQDVIYMKQMGSAYTLDVFKPKTSNHKAIVWMVSGGWVSAHENINLAVAKPFTDRGFTVFQVMHGSQPKYTIPEIVFQVSHSIRFIRANAAKYDINPNAIGVSGASSGGHLSLEIAGLGNDGDPKAPDPVDRVSSRVNAVVAFMPPTDFENWGKPNNLVFTSEILKPLLPAWGITPTTTDAEKLTIARQLSPKNLVQGNFPPTMLVHGDADNIVPVQQSKELDAAFEAAKVGHTLIIVPGGGHDGNAVFKVFNQAIDWFDNHLPAQK